jgi:hypothetical protein
LLSSPVAAGDDTGREWGDEEEQEEESDGGSYASPVRTALLHHSNRTSFDTPAFAGVWKDTGVVQWKGAAHTLRAPAPHALWP